MAKVKLSDWINLNVPDDAIWGQYYVISQSEEYRQGNKIRRETTMRARDATITGKEIKAYLTRSASSLRPAAGVLLGIALAAFFFFMFPSISADLGVFMGIFLPVVGLVLAGLSIHNFLKARGASSEIPVISSWMSLEPYMEAALKEKVLSEEREKRKQEMGNQGEAFSRIYCFSAREVLQVELNANNLDDLYSVLKMKNVAESVPASGLKLTQR